MDGQKTPTESILDEDIDWTQEEPFSIFDFMEAVTALPEHIEHWNREIRDKASRFRRTRSRDRAEDNSENRSRPTYRREYSSYSTTPAKSSAIVGAVIGEDLQSRSVKHKVAAVPRRVNEATNRELAKFRSRVDEKTQSLMTKWREEKTVRTRDKFSFCVGVANLFFSGLLVGIAPEWIPFWYTAQAAYFLPLRVYLYKKRALHYFIFDLCYYVNALLIIWLWALPDSTFLFTAVWCLSYGPLAFAVLTWKNSLVFHSLDKVTSLFIHIDPPFVLHAIKHLYPDAAIRYPALASLPRLQVGKSLLIASLVYSIWQILYYVFIIEARKEKINSGKRPTSFTWLLAKRSGLVGSILAKFPPASQGLAFMGLQFLYAVLTMMPAVFFWYDSIRASSLFLAFTLAVSVWNGAGWYIEVWGRRFEKELLALKREIDQSSAQIANVTVSSSRSSSQGPHGLSPVVAAADAVINEENPTAALADEQQLDHQGDPKAIEPLTGEIDAKQV